MKSELIDSFEDHKHKKLAMVSNEKLLKIFQINCPSIVSLKFMPKLPANENIKLFNNYILKTYIASDSTFSLNLWAEFSTISNRTTNSCDFKIRSKELCKKSKHNVEKENIVREQNT
ncbi:Uncharacterized protein FWK35_00026247, partial [Aphis craccivora]